MSQNIEIKARCANLSQFEQRLQTLPVRFEGEDRQIDTFYKVSRGRLKLRESSLDGNLLIPYMRPDLPKAKESVYTLIRIEDSKTTKLLLEQLLGIEQVVTKTRRIYHFENVRIHLDEVENLGVFIELEAVLLDDTDKDIDHRKVQDLLNYLNIETKDLLVGAYADMFPKQPV